MSKPHDGGGGHGDVGVDDGAVAAVPEDGVGVEARPEDPQDERAQVREEVGGVPKQYRETLATQSKHTEGRQRSHLGKVHISTELRRRR